MDADKSIDTNMDKSMCFHVHLNVQVYFYVYKVSFWTRTWIWS